MALPRPSLLLAGMLTLPLLLTACGGTPFGDTLARSFSRAPIPTAPAPTPRTVAPTTPPPTPATPTRPSATTTPASPAVPATRPAETATTARPAQASKPAPYRVTIRLPEADPSAPAEVVTRALRAAGVPFEVETIERMPTSGAQAPETPAGASGAAPPTSRPAPAPR